MSRFPFSIRLPLLFLLAVALPSVLASTLSVAIGQNVLRAKALETNTNSLNVYVSAVRYYLEHARSLLETTAAFTNLGDLAYESYIDAELHGIPGSMDMPKREIAMRILEHSSVFEYVALLRKDFVIYLIEPYALQHITRRGDMAAFSNLKMDCQKGTVISDLAVSPVTQRPSVIIATPVCNLQGELLAIWAGAMRLDIFSAIGTDKNPNHEMQSHGYLTDRKGLVIAYQAHINFVENLTDFSKLDPVRLALAGEAGAGEWTDPGDSRRMFGAYMPLPETGWAVVYAQPVEYALQVVNQLTTAIGIASLLSILVVGLASFPMVRQIVQPIRQMTESVRTMMRGDFTQPVKVKTGDEIGLLGKAFNQMQLALSEKEKQLSAYAEELEQRVIERTIALQSSEAEMSALFVAMTDIILVVDAQGICLKAAPTSPASDYKLPPDVIGKSLFDLFLSDDSEVFVQKIQGTLETQQPNTFEFSVKCEANELWFSAVLSPLDDHRVMIVADDVTTRRRMEDAHRESQRMLSTLMSNLSGMVYRCRNDRNWSMEYVSQGAFELTGYAPSDFIDNHKLAYADVIHPEDQNRVWEVIQTALLSDHSYKVTYRIVTAAGETKWVFEHGRGVWSDTGKLVALEGFINDITEQKLAEDKIRQLNEELEKRVELRTAQLHIANQELLAEVNERREIQVSLQEERNFISAVLDTAGYLVDVLDYEGRIVRFNRACEQLSGYMFEEVQGKYVWEILIAPENIEQVKERILRLANERQPNQGENYWVTRNGDKRLISWKNTILLDENGDLRYSIGTGIDITEHRQMEDELRRARDELERRVLERTDELERSNKELELFAYVASHDLQEPLRMITSYLQLLQRRYKDRLDQDATEFIGFAVDGAARLQRLINDLLMYSRVGTRGKELSTIDSQQILRQVLKNLEMLIEENKVIITQDCLPMIMADDIQLTQLFQNLIGNAIKFRKPGIQPEIHIGVRREKNDWIFSIRDNGIGIEAQYFERIFVIFQRLHNREEYPGTGIGLAICKRIVQRHGGWIWVESVPENGSTFFFTVPVRSS